MKGNNSPQPEYRIFSEEILNNELFKNIPLQNIKNKNLTLEKIILSKNRFNSKITIISLGPLTNIAKLFLENPSIKKYIKEVWIMGGNINTEGNITCYYENSFKKLKKAEFNFFIDPYAAKIVINSNLKIFLIPQ